VSEAELSRRLAALEAINDIHTMVGGYCDLVDAMEEPEAVGALFQPDGVLRAPKQFGGREAISDFYRGAFGSGMSFSRHSVLNPRIELRGPDEAIYRSRLIVFIGWGGGSYLGWGTYEDTLERTDGGWAYRLKQTDIAAMVSLETGWGGDVAAARPWLG
jgi:hypothetical protein